MSQADDLKNAFDDVEYSLSKLVRGDLHNVSEALIDLESALVDLNSEIIYSENVLEGYDEYREIMETHELSPSDVEELVEFKAEHIDEEEALQADLELYKQKLHESEHQVRDLRILLKQIAREALTEAQLDLEPKQIAREALTEQLELDV